MESEDSGNGVGALEPVDDCAGDIRDTATENENHHGEVRRGQVRDVHDGHESENQVERHVGPAGCTQPHDTEQDAESGTDPHAQQEPESLVSREREHAKRRVRSGDEDEDIGVIKAAEHCLYGR